MGERLFGFKKQAKESELYYLSELILTLFVLFFFISLYRLHPNSPLCWIIHSKQGFSITYILLIDISSILILLMYFKSNSKVRTKNLNFINQSFVNLTLSLLGTFYFFNWYSSGCTGYIGLHRIFLVLLSIPCIFALKSLFVLIDKINQRKSKFTNLRESIIYSIFTNSLFYELMLIIFLLTFYFSLPILYPKIGYFCDFGLYYSARSTSIALFSFIFFISNAFLLISLLSRRTMNENIVHLFQVRVLFFVIGLLGIRKFRFYDWANCIEFNQVIWFMINSIPWLMAISLVLLILKKFLKISVK